MIFYCLSITFSLKPLLFNDTCLFVILSKAALSDLGRISPLNTDSSTVNMKQNTQNDKIANVIKIGKKMSLHFFAFRALYGTENA